VQIDRLQRLADTKDTIEAKLFEITLEIAAPSENKPHVHTHYTKEKGKLRVLLHAAKVQGKRRKMSMKDENTSHLIETVERTAMLPKDFTRRLPRPVVVEVFVNGKPARALIDSGSLADFMSTTLADQLHVTKEVLAKPLALQ
jgi:hypothetical protein